MSKLTKRQEQLVRQAFLNSVSGIKNSTSIAALEAAIATGRIDQVAKVLGMTPGAFTQLAEQINTAYMIAAGATAEAIGKVPVPDLGKVQFRFNPGDPTAAKWLTQHSATLVTEIVADQMIAIRQALAYDMRLGANPRESALSLVGRIDPRTGKRTGGIVGLTSQQTMWIEGAHRQLTEGSADYFARELRDKRFDNAIMAYVRDGEAPPNDLIRAAISSMENRTLKYRGDTIGRTESINAMRAGQFESISQAVDLGEVAEKDVKKVWDATGDDRTRPDHLEMDGQTAPLEQAFVAPDGSMLMFPGDTSMNAAAGQTINCRCAVDYQVDFIGKSARIEGYG